MLMRLQFRSRAKAMSVARDFDLSGVHKHEMKGETIYMPGKTHKKLNKQLRKRNLPPAKKPSQRDMGMGGMGMMGMAMQGGEKDGEMASDMERDFQGLGEMMDPGTGLEEVDDTFTGKADTDVDNSFQDKTSVEVDNAFDLGLKGDKDNDGDMEIY
jgi:hypothetical protein